MADKDVLAVKKITSVLDELLKNEIYRSFISTVQNCVTTFQSAYSTRRNELLQLNAIYRNKSYLDKDRASWQTKVFIPMSYDAVERKTSMVHEALWGNRLASPFTVIGKTAEDNEYAFSAETLLNNTMDTIGFYDTSEEGIRSTVKYGLGVYRYGISVRKESFLVRETKRDEDGVVLRDDKSKRPIYAYAKRDVTRRLPFIRAVDIVDGFGWEPSAKKIDKYSCQWCYEIQEMSGDEIYEREEIGEFEKGTYDKLTKSDPHGINGIQFDSKTSQIRRDEGVQDGFLAPKSKYQVLYWFGWFDVDGDKRREFIKGILIDGRIVASAEENLLNEYPFVDVQYTKSLHSLTPWGVLDPVVSLQYEANEIHCQRGDTNKLMLSPQFLINVDKINDDHAYVSFPGAFHPVNTGENPPSVAIQPLQFQNLSFISTNEEDRIANWFSTGTGVADFQKILNSSGKNTPASTVISILNEQQSGNSMIVNGILNRHGFLGGRILRILQLFGDEEFILRSAGKRGFKFHTESLENILGDFDVKVTTSTFFGNRQIELQYLIQLRPLWAQAQHINQVELDKAILENILPKKSDKILLIPEDPLSPIEEQLLFVYGQGESVDINDQEKYEDLYAKIKAHKSFKLSPAYLKLDGVTKEEFNTYLEKLTLRMQTLEAQRQIQAQEAAKAQAAQGMPGMPLAPGGNMQNSGLPEVRTMGNLMAPKVNDFE